jgi:lysophospholipase L1-like esterase
MVTLLDFLRLRAFVACLTLQVLYPIKNFSTLSNSNSRSIDMSSRRNFLRNAALGGAMAMSLPEIAAAAIPADTKKITLKPGSTILFQGDSITDAGRDREEMAPNHGGALGGGYAFLAAAALMYQHAGKDLKIYNKGISGNKVYQLAERWDKDCLDLKPDVLSILIGVNDYWHLRNGNYDGTVEKYRTDFNALLDRTKKQLPNVQLIICEPFAIKGTKAVDDTWFPAFTAYQTAARELADSFGATFMPFQSLFDKAQKKAPGAYWAPDGVHPSLAGAQLMAAAWVDVVE